MVGMIGVSDQTPTVFMPPGVNYSVGVGIGFNGMKLIPLSDSPDEFLYGSGQHIHPAGWQVQNGVDVFFRQNNRYPHRIYVAFDLDRRPTQVQSGPSLVMPR